MNNFNLSDAKKEALLNMASKKLGQSPQQLQQKVESGQIGELIGNLDPKTASRVNSVLQNPQALEALLGSDAAKSLLGGLTGNRDK